MTTFRIARHTMRAGEVVEVIGEDGKLLATLYATDDQHLRLVSKLLDDVTVDPLHPPVANITLRKLVP